MRMKANKTMDSAAIEKELFERYPELTVCKDSFEDAYRALLSCFRNGGKLLLAGNGGSAADSDHISGELNKSFMFRRALDEEFVRNLEGLYGDEGKELSKNLEGGLPAIPLMGMTATNSAFANDTDPKAAVAQLVQVLGRKGDVFLGITTSGNSENIVKAIMAARARGLTSIILTGEKGGRCRDMADICIRVPENETFKVQELHLPVYHALCLMIEADIFDAV